MAFYFLLGTLTENGQRMLRENPDLLAETIRASEDPEVRILGQYAVIGKQDFVILAEAEDNEAIARHSLEIGVGAGLHIETLPAIAIGVLAEPSLEEPATSDGSADEPASPWIVRGRESLPSLTDVYRPRE